MITSGLRRFVAVLALLLSAVMALAACGGSSTSSAPGQSAGSAASGAFPVTITHKFGQTEIKAAPQRVVSLGYTDQDAILALGVVPVAIREFTGDKPSATWPWASDKLQGQQPQVIKGDLSAESLAALRPDLIIAVSAGLTKDQYDTFSRIAPVVSQPAEFVDYGTPWQDATTIIGKALGKGAEADKLVADVQAKIDAAKAKYPNLAGKTFAGVLPSTSDNASFFVWGPQDLRARFFQSLGMEVPPTFAQQAGSSFYATISTEQLSSLDQADIVALIPSSQDQRATFEALPGFANLTAVKDKKYIAFDADQAGALSFSSVLSLPTLLDTVPGQLSAAVGD